MLCICRHPRDVSVYRNFHPAGGRRNPHLRVTVLSEHIKTQRGGWKMASQNIDMISNYITLGVFLTVAIQVWETTRPMKGRGLLLLLGDVHALGAVPWIIAVFFQRASWIDVLLPIAIGCLLSLPMILSTKFVSTANGSMRFKRSVFLYLCLIGIPFLRRYIGINWLFKQHPVFISHTHIPDTDLMIVMYLTIIVVNIYAWRIFSYLKFRRLQRELARNDQ
jgi:membrane protein CcdC involved in cytochrome C biogenesis